LPIPATEPLTATPSESIAGGGLTLGAAPSVSPTAVIPSAATRGTAADSPPAAPPLEATSGSQQPATAKPPMLPPMESAVTSGLAEVAGRIGPPSEAASLGADAIGADAALSAAASSAGSAAPPVKIAKLVVTPGSETAVAGDTERHGSLAAACRRAAELGLTEIELQFDGELLEQPFETTGKLLTVRAAAGRRPTLLFRPAAAGLAADRSMIRSAGPGKSSLQFENVNLRLELPAESASGWSLFALGPQQTLELNDCVLTIRDRGPFGAPNHVQVAAIAVQSRRSSEMMLLDEEIGMSQPATILLNRCIARGQAALVSMPDETPLRIVWSQGLFVSTQHLLETGGTTMKPTVFNRIEIDLTRVTLMAQQGIYQMRRRSGTDHHLDVDVQSSNNILSPALGAALFEFAGVASEEEVKLKFAGGDNCYPRVDLAFVRIKPQGGSEIDFDLNHRERWSQERRPDPAVEFQSPPPADLPLDEHTKQHYLLSEDTMSDAGFDPTLLPDIIPPPALPPEGDSETPADPSPLP
jgi:hypothetical protein